MKYYFVALFMLIINTKVLCQQDSNEVMNIILPTNTVKISGQQANDIHKKFNIEMASQIQDHAYKKNGIFFYYRQMQGDSIERKDLEKQHIDYFEYNYKRSLGLFKRFKAAGIVDTSYIHRKNGIRFSIIEFHNLNKYYILLSSDFSKNLKYLICRIGDFDIKNKVKAEAIMTEILNSIDFKN